MFELDELEELEDLEELDDFLVEELLVLVFSVLVLAVLVVLEAAARFCSASVRALPCDCAFAFAAATLLDTLEVVVLILSYCFCAFVLRSLPPAPVIMAYPPIPALSVQPDSLLSSSFSGSSFFFVPTCLSAPIKSLTSPREKSFDNSCEIALVSTLPVAPELFALL